MTDKETLILAAKAAGVTGLNKPNGSIVVHDKYGVSKTWNPFTSNDDCFRLETALGLEVVWWEDRVHCVNEDVDVTNEYFADHNGDKDKARRYASTRAAALRGRE